MVHISVLLVPNMVPIAEKHIISVLGKKEGKKRCFLRSCFPDTYSKDKIPQNMGDGKHLWQILITTLQILLISFSSALLTRSILECIILVHFHLYSPTSISPGILQFTGFLAY